jgi:hypothetical protein
MDYELAKSLMDAGFPQTGKGSLIGSLNKLVWRSGDRVYTPPKIFKQRARLIKLMAEASMTLNEHMKVTDDPDFKFSFDNDDELFAALEEAIHEREELEYNLAYLMNELIYYDQEEWGEHNCESIILNTEDEWEKRSKSAVPCMKAAKSEAAR